MIIALIAAMSRNRVIGRDNQLVFRIPDDLKRFRKLTTGHPVVLGRKTYQSIGRLLPDRQNVILTRDPAFRVEGARMAHSLDEALAPYRGTNQVVFVLGGAEIYRLALPIADRIHLTLVHQDAEGDAYFPEFEGAGFEVLNREDRSDPLSYSFIDYQRR